MDPDEPQSRLLLSRAYREQGRLNQACTLLRGLPTELSRQVKDECADCPEP
jgi:cytochrome c-type biogenesis protein CcmH/NrfG